jgi:Undecaprenyl-phosphate glucose phosphotransferase
MTATPEIAPASGRSYWRSALARSVVSLIGVAADAAIIIAASALTSSVYHFVVYGWIGPWTDSLLIGGAAASIFMLPGLARGDYSPSNYYSFKPHIRRVFFLWNVTFLWLLALGFLAKTTDVYSRGAIILFYAAGLPAILLLRSALVHAVVLGSKFGLVSAQRVFLIGGEADVEAFVRRYRPWDIGLHIVGVAPLSDIPESASAATRKAALARDIRQTVEATRSCAPDAVFVIAPWSETELIDLCVEELLTIPVEIHLGPERILDRFDHVRICKLGAMTTLQITRAPLSMFEVLQKRAFDIVLSATALVLLAPLLACVALLIRLESGGPVLFRQRRYGFNQQPFRIMKFRTMTTLDDGDVVPQATRNDERVTPVGRWLRQFNIDELPQLINVLKGDMSLVGPRPHALSHDREYEQKIALYARRHNVRPGITGWAQVNGFRGETDTDEKMRRRVDHDLYYIDNWSPWLDIRILLLTLFSHRSYRNAV